MFEGKSFLDIIQIGGFTMYILLFCSIVSVTVIVERLLAIRARVKNDPTDFMARLSQSIESGDVSGARALCAAEKSPFSSVADAGLKTYGKSGEKIANAMDRQITVEVKDLERSLSVLGTIGSTVVYIGLFGTVLGIIRSFQQIAQTAGGQGGMDTVITGIAEALICTATGILVAVPAVIAYNLLTKRVENIATDMELVASETADLLAKD
jgi:biopolymer transport protein ExbB/TolQ